MKTRFRVAAALSLSVFAFASNAASSKDQALGDCVTLGAGKEIVRAGNGQQFFLKDGDSHYRIAFKNSCSSIVTASKLEISTDGETNRLCPQGTQVRTKRDTCKVGEVERIDADEFANRKRARR